jgi:hypothetical protein
MKGCVPVKLRTSIASTDPSVGTVMTDSVTALEVGKIDLGKSIAV